MEIGPAKSRLLFWALVFAGLLPWVYFRCLQTIHPDILWLYEAMDRVFNGSTMAQSAYETNPPLSLLLYIIPVALKEYFGLPFHVTGFIQSVAIFVIGALALNHVLKDFSLRHNHRTMILLGFAVASTVCTMTLFGERDQLIAMIAPAYVLISLSLTNGTHRVTTRTWGFLILASILILLKPHLGPLLVAFLLHRLWKKGLFSVLRAPDFQVMTATVLAYAGVILLFFRDYIDIIFIDVVRYYLPMDVRDANLWFALCAFLGLGLALLAIIRYHYQDPGMRPPYYALAASGILALISVAAQKKGFPYHYFPALTLYLCAGVPIIYDALVSQTRRQALSVYLTATVLILFSYMVCRFDTGHARHDNYNSLPLPQLIAAGAKKYNSGSYFIFNNNMSLIHEVSYYTGLRHASRFPVLWFLPALYNTTAQYNMGHLNSSQKSLLEEDIWRYGAMMAEDLEIYKPGIVLILTEDSFSPPVNPLKFFGGHRLFKEAWSHYVPGGTITLSEGQYYGDKLIDKEEPKRFDIYYRDR